MEAETVVNQGNIVVNRLWNANELYDSPSLDSSILKSVYPSVGPIASDDVNLRNLPSNQFIEKFVNFRMAS